MTFGKRLFDIGFAIVLSGPIFLALVILWITARIRGEQGGFLYLSERMKTPDQSFQLYKVRTMYAENGIVNFGATGGDKAHRITTFGRFLRKTRLDELPQIFNVLKGDMSFVGPRPPERGYVEQFPKIYDQVLRDKPGITGLATVFYHDHEERMLAKCTSWVQTETVYKRCCIPRKAALDLLYNKHKNICFDIYIIQLTVAKVLPRPFA